MAVAAVSLDETQSAFNPENQPQVAAIAGKAQNKGQPGKGKNKKNKNKNKD